MKRKLLKDREQEAPKESSSWVSFLTLEYYQCFFDITSAQVQDTYCPYHACMHACKFNTVGSGCNCKEISKMQLLDSQTTLYYINMHTLTLCKHNDLIIYVWRLKLLKHKS